MDKRIINYKKRMGFTLAEVLITLLIIGVIASIIIPGLIADTQRAEFKVAWKKAYANFTIVHKQVIADGVLPAYDLDALFQEYGRHYSYIKYCTDSEEQGCWHKLNQYKTYSGKLVQSGDFYCGYLLSDGSMFAASYYMDTVGGQGNLYSNNKYIIVYFDVNGFKGPNKMGIDIFAIQVFSNKILPAGVSWCSESDCCSLTDTGTYLSKGVGCSSKAILGENY